jgi:hypothetical protein
MGDVVPIGLGARLPDPFSVWPTTTVVELAPEVAIRLPVDADEKADAIRAALATLGGITEEAVGSVEVTETTRQTLLVCMPADGPALRALSVAAQRRATNVAEALHAVLSDSA